MLERDEAARRRLEKAHISDSVLAFSLTLFNDLPRFLNGTRTSDGKRVVQILEAMLELERLSSPVSGIVWPAMSLERTDPKRFKALCEIQDKNYALSKELAKFKFVPSADVMVGGGGGPSEWAAIWRLSNKKPEKHLRMDAGEALQMILKLTQIGYLTRTASLCSVSKMVIREIRTPSLLFNGRVNRRNTRRVSDSKRHRRRYMRDRYEKLIKNPFGRRNKVTDFV